jgi:hypothetical protein
VDSRAGLDDAEKRKFLALPGLELRPLGHPARSQSQYRLRSFGFFFIITNVGGIENPVLYVRRFPVNFFAHDKAQYSR